MIANPKSVEHASDNFAKILNANSSRAIPSDLESILAEIKQVRNLPEDLSVVSKDLKDRNIRYKNDKLAELTEHYVGAMLSREFPLLSPELFDLKRYVLVHRTGNSTDSTYEILEEKTSEIESLDNLSHIGHKVVPLPLFAYVDLSKNNLKSVLGRCSFNYSARDDDRGIWVNGTERITFSAELPGGKSIDVVSGYNEALRRYCGVIDRIEKPGVGVDRDKLAKPEVGAIWIPRIQGINVLVKRAQKKKDPAIILRLDNRSYLVKTWEVGGERPFKHYLREFSEGGLKID